MKHIMITLAIVAVSIAASAKCVYFISGDALQLQTKCTYLNGDRVKLDIQGTLTKDQIPSPEDVVYVKVGNSVDNIEQYAFTNCINLAKIHILKNVKNIE